MRREVGKADVCLPVRDADDLCVGLAWRSWIPKILPEKRLIGMILAYWGVGDSKKVQGLPGIEIIVPLLTFLESSRIHGDSVSGN